MDYKWGENAGRWFILVVALLSLAVIIGVVTLKPKKPAPESPRQSSTTITCPANCTCSLDSKGMNVECKNAEPAPVVPPEIIRETKTIVEYRDDPAITVIGISREGDRCTAYVRLRISGEWHAVGLNCAGK